MVSAFSLRVVICALASTLSWRTFLTAQRGEHTACIGWKGTKELRQIGHGRGLELNGFTG